MKRHLAEWLFRLHRRVVYGATPSMEVRLRFDKMVDGITINSLVTPHLSPYVASYESDELVVVGHRSEIAAIVALLSSIGIEFEILVDGYTPDGELLTTVGMEPEPYLAHFAQGESDE